MKRIVKCIMVTLCLAVAVAFAAGIATNVSAKSKVTYKLKKGTLTIKGKGNMPKKLKVKKSKVKKIVIKKGVKNISNNAFKNFKKMTKVTIAKSVKQIGVNAFQNTKIKKLTIPKGTKKLGSGFINNCKKLDVVTLPGDFNIINKSGTVSKVRGAAKGTDLDTVIFNSNLDYNAAAYFKTMNFQTAANDSKFKTFDGVIYTKDGSGLVRVPSARDTIAIKEGCTDFNTFAVTYKSSSNSSYVCYDLVRVTLPSTLARVNEEAYPDVTNSADQSRALDIIMDKAKLEMPEIVKLKNTFMISAETLMKKLPARVVKSGDFYVGDVKYLIQGDNNATSNVPDGITNICAKAYTGLAATKVVLPASVTAIDSKAFMFSNLKEINLENIKTIGAAAFKGTSVNKVELPATITALADETFCDCPDLTEVTFKGELKSVGAYALSNTRIKVADFLTANTKLETIGESAFFNTGWSNITIPANIKTVGAYAFNETNNSKFCLIKGSTAGFDVNAFGAKSNVTFQFEQGITQAWVSPDFDYYKSGKKMKLSVWWDKVSEVNGYEIWMAKDKALKKGVKKYSAKYNEKSKTISLAKKKAKGLKYFGIRPYKTVNGKKVYGKWAINAL